MLKAKGFVAALRLRIDMHDAFTRMNQAREQEQEIRRVQQEQDARKAVRRRAEAEAIQSAFSSVFAIEDPSKRGRTLEDVLNRLFKHHGVLVREAFSVRNPESGKAMEQIDGVVEIRSRLCLIEVKFCGDPPGPPEITHHLGRVMLRGRTADGLFISANGYPSTAIATVREALAAGFVIGLCELSDFVPIVEGRMDLSDYLRRRLDAAILKDNYARR